MTSENKKIQLYLDVWETFGAYSQMDMLIEEMAELTQAILKTRRNGLVFSREVYEEYADVLICMEQVEAQLKRFPSSAGGTARDIVETIKDEKMVRLKSRLDKLGYKSIHKDAKLKKDHVTKEIFEKFKNFGVEIQIRTLCENVWADIYHDIGYKPENIVDPQIKRQLHCLGGLLEIADNNFSKINEGVKNSRELTPEFILHCLERPYIKLFRVKYDPRYSIENLKFLRDLLEFESTDSFKKTIDDFIKKHETKIVFIRKERGNVLALNPLATQPEVLIVFYLIETDPYILRDRWEEKFSRKYLDELSTWWSNPIFV